MPNYSEELTLALKLEGAEKVGALTDMLNDQTQSVYDRASASRFLKQAVNEEYTAAERASGVARDAEVALNQWGNTAHDLSLRVASDNGKIKDSYFTLGAAMREQLMGIRTEHRVTGEALLALGMTGKSALGETLGQISALNVSAKIMSATLSQAGGVGAMFGGVLSGFALPLAATVGAIVSLNKQMDELNDRWKKAGDEAFQLRIRLGELDAQAQLNFVRQNLRDAQEELQKIHPEMGFFGTVSALTGGIGGIQAGVSAAEKEAMVKYAEQLNVVNELRADEKDLVKQLYDAQIAKADAADKIEDKAEQRTKQGYADRVVLAEQNAKLEKGGLTDVLAALDAQISITTNVRERNELLIKRNQLEQDNMRVLIAEGAGPGTLQDATTLRNQQMMHPTLQGLPGQQTMPQIQADTVRQINTAIAESELRTKSFNAAWGQLTTTMSSQTANTIAGGFQSAFGIGHTLLGQFATDFLTTFAKLAESNVLKGLFSWISGGFGGSLFGLIGQAFGGGGGGGLDEGTLEMIGAGGYSSPVIGAASYTSSSGARSLAPIVDAISNFNTNLKLTMSYDTLTAAVDRGNTLIKQRRS